MLPQMTAVIEDKRKLYEEHCDGSQIIIKKAGPMGSKGPIKIKTVSVHGVVWKSSKRSEAL